MATARWTVGAQADLANLLAFIELRSEANARLVASRLQHSIAQIESFPRIGRVVPEYRDDSVRELVIRPYRMLYRVLNDENVLILGIVDSRRDFYAVFGDQPPPTQS